MLLTLPAVHILSDLRFEQSKFCIKEYDTTIHQTQPIRDRPGLTMADGNDIRVGKKETMKFAPQTATVTITITLTIGQPRPADSHGDSGIRKFLHPRGLDHIKIEIL